MFNFKRTMPLAVLVICGAVSANVQALDTQQVAQLMKKPMATAYRINHLKSYRWCACTKIKNWIRPVCTMFILVPIESHSWCLNRQSRLVKKC